MTTTVSEIVAIQECQTDIESANRPQATNAAKRLKEFLKEPTLALKTEDELIIIPSSAIEIISFALPESESKQLPLENLRKATRLK